MSNYKTKGVRALKNYKVFVVFKNGQELSFETNTNVRTSKRMDIGGEKFIVTDEQHVIGVNAVKKMVVSKNR